MPDIVVCRIEDERWQGLELETLAERAARATLVHQGLDPGLFEISLLGCGDAEIAQLNAQFRGKPVPTNVLSWPQDDLAAAVPGAQPAAPLMDEDPKELGDIALAWDTCETEAAQGGKPMADHATHLLVHAVLHLLGYDHVRDADATVMEEREVAILGRLGLDDPYREVDGAAAPLFG